MTARAARPRQRRRPIGTRVTAALIVRDEERFLAGCLASLAGRVDEIVVADTGSVDRTREIALEHGARLIEHRWADDFAAARNVALDAASGDWILYVDADERLAAWRAGRIDSWMTPRNRRSRRLRNSRCSR